MKDVLQQSPPQQVNLTTNQSASATSTVSLAALSKLHLNGNSSPEKRKKFINCQHFCICSNNHPHVIDQH
jgi:hypothetical protein